MEVAERKINKFNLKLIKTNKFKTVCIRFVFEKELDYEKIGAYNLLARLISSRNEKYPTMDKFSAYLEDNYGMNVIGLYNYRANIGIFTFLSLCVHSRFSLNEDLLAKQVETMKDCLYSPVFSEDALREIKDMYITTLKDRLDKKGYVLSKEVGNILGKDTPYGVNIDSTIEDIEKVTLDDIKKVYEELLDSRATIYVIGDVDLDYLSSLVSNLPFISKEINFDLSYLKEIPKLGVKVFPSSFLRSAIDIVYESNITVNDSLLVPMKVFIEMLNYDLFRIIREQYNYCYYIYATSSNYLNMLEIISEIESKNLEHILELVNGIIDKYTTDFDNDKFELCKEKMIHYIEESEDSPLDYLELQYGFDFNKNFKTSDELKKRYMSVTKEEVIEVAKSLSYRFTGILKEGTNNG